MQTEPKRVKGPMCFDRRLAAYAAGAGAIVAGAEAADAAVVYSGPQDISISFGQPYDLEMIAGNTFTTYAFSSTPGTTAGSGTASTLTVSGGECDDVATIANPGEAYTAGTDVESLDSFASSNGGITLAAISTTDVGSGPFYGVSDEYLALDFAPDGFYPDGADYGWIELSVSGGTDPTLGPTATIEGWAYDDAGGDILTGELPEPTALALLAMGASALLMRRPRGRPSASVR